MKLKDLLQVQAWETISAVKAYCHLEFGSKCEQWKHLPCVPFHSHRLVVLFTPWSWVLDSRMEKYRIKFYCSTAAWPAYLYLYIYIYILGRRLQNKPFPHFLGRTCSDVIAGYSREPDTVVDIAPSPPILSPCFLQLSLSQTSWAIPSCGCSEREGMDACGERRSFCSIIFQHSSSSSLLCQWIAFGRTTAMKQAPK